MRRSKRADVGFIKLGDGRVMEQIDQVISGHKAI